MDAEQNLNELVARQPRATSVACQRALFSVVRQPRAISIAHQRVLFSVARASTRVISILHAGYGDPTILAELHSLREL